MNRYEGHLAIGVLFAIFATLQHFQVLAIIGYVISLAYLAFAFVELLREEA